MTSHEAQMLLLRALAEPRGLLLRSSDPAKTREVLYRARQQLADARLDGLQIRLVEIGEGNMVICKRLQPAVPVTQPPEARAIAHLSPSIEDLDL